MFRSIGEFIGKSPAAAAIRKRSARPISRLAAAALLVHVATLDQNFDAAEHTKLRDVLAYRFDLGLEEAEKLLQAALRADKEAVDLYRFTSVLNHALDEEGRARIVQMMFGGRSMPTASSANSRTTWSGARRNSERAGARAGHAAPADAGRKGRETELTMHRSAILRGPGRPA